MLYILMLVIVPICLDLIINCCFKKITTEEKTKAKFWCAMMYSAFEIIILLITLYNHNYVHDYNLTSYYVNYSNGFVSRGLIGTIFDLLFEYNFLFEYKVIAVHMLVFVITYILQFVIYAKISKKLLEKNNFFEDYFFLFMTSFANISFFLICECMGIKFIEFMKLDVFNYLITLIITILFLRKNPGVFTYIITIILASISILIHQGSFFTYHNLILFLVGYESFFINKKLTKKILFFVFFIVTSSVFLICQFVDVVPYETIVEETSKRIRQAEQPYTIQHDEVLTMEYEVSVLEHFKIYGVYYVIAFWCRGIEFLIKYLMVPYVFIYALMQKNKTVFKSKLIKLFLLYVIVVKLAVFLLTLDWIRWIAFMLQEITLAIAYLLMKDKIENLKLGE